MAAFDDLIEAQLAGATVRAAPLVAFAFKSGVGRYWPGFGTLVAGDASWQGIGNLGTLSPITGGTSGAIDEITFSLTGDTSILAHLEEDADESDGREVNVYLQFFDLRRQDEDGNWVDWRTLADPISLFWGTMGPLMPQMSPPDENGRRQRIIAVRAQSAFFNVNRPRYRFFSDRDQKARDPTHTDNIFVKTSQFAEGTIRWPQF